MLKLTSSKAIAFIPTLSVFNTIAIVVGLVVGAGIFETPAIVAANASSAEMVIFAWIVGGAISLIGALCYAELATTYPNPGGTYCYLKQGFSGTIGFLFGWSRMSIIQTGSIALLAFVFGDYISQLWRLGTYSSAIYAAIAIIFLTGLNWLGVSQSKNTQTLLAFAQIAGLIVVSIVSLIISFSSPTAASIATANNTENIATSSSSGLMMVFVLLTYGGWNEAAYVSAEVRNGRRNIVRALIWSIGIITALYLLVNWALIRGLGLSRMATSQAVVADLMRTSIGEAGAVAISCLVAVATICSLNATIFTGARANYALGRDFSLFAFLGRGHKSSPTNALIVQGAIALLLVLIGSFTRQGFETIVNYTAPAFWFFFLLSGISLFLLRRRDPQIYRPFEVPFYPLTPLIFCGICAYMLRSSIAYTGWGGLLGIMVLLLGLPLLWMSKKSSSSHP
ncbi:amino acid permease [Pleurocapsales cyanobacterium LEGE 10410]|nr:amino acid permease [Pleurocapsales cyanobacterium LEGE 10410]